jgi:pyruvyl transferase EpsO
MRPALPSRLHYYQALSQRRLDRGVAILSQGRSVATDRLHAHIISVLLGMPHWVADNSTGKIHGFIDQWTGASPLVSKVPDLSRFGSAKG